MEQGYQTAPANRTSPSGNVATYGHNMAVDRVLALDALGQDLASANDRLADCLADLRGWLDGVAGSVPEKLEAGNSAKAPQSNARLHELRGRIDYTNQLATSIRTQIQRLQEL